MFIGEVRQEPTSLGSEEVFLDLGTHSLRLSLLEAENDGCPRPGLSFLEIVVEPTTGKSRVRQ